LDGCNPNDSCANKNSNKNNKKNFDFFIKAYTKWSYKKDVSVIIVGGGTITKDETGLIKDLGIKNRVRFLGYVPENNLVGLYNMSEFFIYPSLAEGFGLPILEALSCGTKVLASDISVFKEIGGDFVEYFKSDDLNSLVNAMTKVFLKEKSDDKISNEVQKKFDWGITMEKTIEVYNKITKNNIS